MLKTSLARLQQLSKHTINAKMVTPALTEMLSRNKYDPNIVQEAS
jgi:hypothetical protein